MSTKREIGYRLYRSSGLGRTTSTAVSRVGATTSTGTTTRFGYAQSDSADGHVSVLLDNTDTPVTCTCDSPISNGQRVTVLITPSGSLKALPIGDNIQSSVNEAVQTVDVEYAVNTSSTKAPTEGWSTDSPNFDDGDFIWQRVKTVYVSGNTEYSTPSCISISTSNVGISSTEVKYAISDSGTVAPETGWQDNPPTPQQGKYIWSRTSTFYTDGTSSISYGVSYQGSNGQNGAAGAPGADGHDGVGIASSDVSYQKSNSGTKVPTGTWYDYVPDLDPGDFLWTRTVWEYTDGDSTTTYSVSSRGENGAQGIQGPPGENGQPLYTWIKYADSPNSGMSDKPDGKKYMGIAYNKESSTESDVYGDYQWSLIQGTQGIQGPPGEDGTTYWTWIKYADDDNGNGMSDYPDGKKYIGIAYNKTTQSESTNPGDYAWSLIQGEQGIGVDNIKEQYCLSSSKTSTAGCTWQYTCPEWQEGMYIWTRSEITWSNDDVTYTDPVLATALNQANENAAKVNWYVSSDTDGLHISSVKDNPDSGMNLVLNGERLSFRSGTTEFAYYANSSFHVDEVAFAQGSLGGPGFRIGTAYPATSGSAQKFVSVENLLPAAFGSITRGTSAAKSWTSSDTALTMGYTVNEFDPLDLIYASSSYIRVSSPSSGYTIVTVSASCQFYNLSENQNSALGIYMGTSSSFSSADQILGSVSAGGVNQHITLAPMTIKCTASNTYFFLAGRTTGGGGRTESMSSGRTDSAILTVEIKGIDRSY